MLVFYKCFTGIRICEPQYIANNYNIQGVPQVSLEFQAVTTSTNEQIHVYVEECKIILEHIYNIK